MQDNLEPQLSAQALAKGTEIRELGVDDFARWSRTMVYNFGEPIRPHLERIWSLAQVNRQTGALACQQREFAPPRGLRTPGVAIGVALVLLVGAVGTWTRRVQTLQLTRPERADSDRGKPAGKPLLTADLQSGTSRQPNGSNALTKIDSSTASPGQNSETVKSFRNAAEEGNPDAQQLLGSFYWLGLGVSQDYDEAAKWYRKAAEQGNAEAQSQLGGLYARGEGVRQDYEEAAKWYVRAAQHGSVGAQVALAGSYEAGLGVPRNDSEAYKWYSVAMAQVPGDSPGISLLMNERDSLSKRMTASELTEGQHAADAFLASRERDGRSSGPAPVNGFTTTQQDSQPATTRTDAERQPLPGYAPFRITRKDSVTGQETVVTGVAPRARGPASAVTDFEEGTMLGENVKIVSDIVAEYHSTHTYVGRDVFVCGDMASDVWNMVRTKGINARIQIGDVEQDISSVLESDHAWVMAEISRGKWLALETTAGQVVYWNQNRRYYRGHSFSNPKQLKRYSELLRLLRGFAAREKRARDSYNELVQAYNGANSYGRMGLTSELERRAGAVEQARTDVNGANRALKELLEQK